MKKCKACLEDKPISCFSTTLSHGKLSYKARCAPCDKAYRRAYEQDPNSPHNNKKRVRNGQARKEYKQRWRSDNADKIKNYWQSYYRDPANQRRARSNENNARRKSRQRLGSFEYDRENVISLYLEAAARTKAEGVEYHVDHEVPLMGKNVCGLHVSWNMRIVTKEENERKGNRFLDQ